MTLVQDAHVFRDRFYEIEAMPEGEEKSRTLQTEAHFAMGLLLGHGKPGAAAAVAYLVREAGVVLDLKNAGIE